MREGTSRQEKKEPKIYAHRGASSDHPEHTRQAYVEAVAQGADGFECDIRLTKDGVAILWHDPDMKRATQSRFLGTIADLTFNEVRNQYPAVMQLHELLDLAILNRKDVAIETKHPVPSGHQVEREIARELNLRKVEIEAAGIRIYVMSFSWFAVEFFRRIDLAIEVGLVMLLRSHFSGPYRRFTSAHSLGPPIGAFKKKHSEFKRAQMEGKQLFIWTVDQSVDINFCAENGADVIITNNPGRARKVLGYP